MKPNLLRKLKLLAQIYIYNFRHFFSINNNNKFHEKSIFCRNPRGYFRFHQLRQQAGRATKAICSCDAMKEMVSLSKEIEASPDKAKELRPKLMELGSKFEACEGSLGAEIKQLTGDDLKKYQAELMEKVDKACPENNIMRKK